MKTVPWVTSRIQGGFVTMRKQLEEEEEEEEEKKRNSPSKSRKCI
jgi:hypothetical protein